jgi:protocatechuate 3,4-dioxygenase beta subunit
MNQTTDTAPSHDDGETHEHDLGLHHDLRVLADRDRTDTPLDGVAAKLTGPMTRRRLLGTLGAAGGAVALAACIPVTGGGFSTIPEETAGPYPGDGTNGPNVLTSSGIVRRDITSSFGSMSGTAAGIPLNIRMKITDQSDGAVIKPGAAVYLWHCNRDGGYSLYSSGITNQNYLRGVQVADENGMVYFDSIYPACYSGRWPHIHFEIFETLTAATSGDNAIATSQMALPVAASNAVYATSGYQASVSNFANVSLATDNVFRDGYAHQMANVTGSTSGGYTARLTLAVK